MHHFQTLLVPTDFSDSADRAFVQALWLASRCGSTIHLLHVLEPLETGSLSPLRYAPETVAGNAMPVEVAGDLLAETIRRHRPGDVQVEPVVLQQGPAARAILEYADAKEIGLMIVGSNRHRGILGRRRIGSTTDAIVHRARQPVVVVPAAETEHNHPTAPDEPAMPIRRMLLPEDFSDPAEQAVPLARELAARCEATLSLLFVIEHRTVPVFMDTGLLSFITMEPDPEIVRRSPEALAQLFRNAEGPEVPATFHVRAGDAAHEIIDFALDDGTDLIVLASQDSSHRTRFGLDHVTDQVLRGMPCPVCVVRPGGKPDHE